MKRAILLIMAVIFFIVMVNLRMAGAEKSGSIFDSKYVKYPREVYERYCDHHLTAGGVWDCLDSLELHGLLEMGCDKPSYAWTNQNRPVSTLEGIWKKAPLNFSENVINEPYAPVVHWFYKCEEEATK